MKKDKNLYTFLTKTIKIFTFFSSESIKYERVKCFKLLSGKMCAIHFENLAIKIVYMINLSKIGFAPAQLIVTTFW